MPVPSVSGYNFTTDRQTINSTGATINFTVPAKTFLIKIIGGQCYLKRDSSVADGDAYILDDGEMISFNLQLEFNTTDGVNLCFLKAVGADVEAHFVIGF